jgi:SAM-dependent methyltransferase
VDIDRLVEMGLGSTSTLVDFGAGTGTFALAATRVCAHVIAVDVSRTMLAIAKREATRLSVDNLITVEAGFLTYEHAGPPADAVYSRNALHHLPDFWKTIALSRIAAILAPGGLFLLRDLVLSAQPSEAVEKVEAWLAAGAARPEEGWTRAERAKDVREEHITFAWLLEAMLAHAGFDLLDTEDDEIYGAHLCRKAT